MGEGALCLYFKSSPSTPHLKPLPLVNQSPSRLPSFASPSVSLRCGGCLASSWTRGAGGRRGCPRGLRLGPSGDGRASRQVQVGALRGQPAVPRACSGGKLWPYSLLGASGPRAPGRAPRAAAGAAPRAGGPAPGAPRRSPRPPRGPPGALPRARRARGAARSPPRPGARWQLRQRIMEHKITPRGERAGPAAGEAISLACRARQPEGRPPSHGPSGGLGKTKAEPKDLNRS